LLRCAAVFTRYVDAAREWLRATFALPRRHALFMPPCCYAGAIIAAFRHAYRHRRRPSPISRFATAVAEVMVVILPPLIDDDATIYDDFAAPTPFYFHVYATVTRTR